MTSRQRLEIRQIQRLKLNPSLQTSIQLLRTDTAGLTRYLEEQAIENPHLRLDPAPSPAISDWLPRWTGTIATSGFSNAVETAADAAPSLMAHVMTAMDHMGLPQHDQRVALALAEALEPSGWIGAALHVIAADVGVALPEVERILAKLQTIEPAGLFARNLAECLQLQAQDAGILDTAMKVLLNNLDLLASGDLARLARVCDVQPSQISTMFRSIRAMNPKPGSQFATLGAAHVREPDLVVRMQPDGSWSIALNKSAMPSLRVEKSTHGGADALAQAKSLQRLVLARNSTLLLVAQEIFARQHEAVRIGPIAVLPMTMAEIADALNMHESTISRVVAGASLDTPRGTWWLRQMFSIALGGNGAPLISGVALRHRLARLIAAEDAGKPLSDAALSQQLAADAGVLIARRTVAKYREVQGIPPAHRRKRRPIIPIMSPNGRKT